MNLNRLRNVLSPAAGECQRDESEDGDERELGFTMRTASASGGAAAQFGTVAFTDGRGRAQDLGCYQNRIFDPRWCSSEPAGEHKSPARFILSGGRAMQGAYVRRRKEAVEGVRP